LTERSIGMEPAEAMLQWTGEVAPGSDFVVGAAEAIPVLSKSMDLMTAAGSLNYVHLDLFFGEAARVLTPHGLLVVYDFSPGRSFRDGPELDRWFTRFQERYPPPRSEARPLNPSILAQLDRRFKVRHHEEFDIGVRLTPVFYLNYMLTETNVAFAVRCGVPHAEIRSWCEDTLHPVWNGNEQEVIFRGYFACMFVDMQ
jgi:SAM-dependent methyltransferase